MFRAGFGLEFGLEFIFTSAGTNVKFLSGHRPSAGVCEGKRSPDIAALTLAGPLLMVRLSSLLFLNHGREAACVICRQADTPPSAL